MTDPIAFLLAAFALLATPGPTNTLLATSGAAAGFLRSLRLVGAESIGYAIAITVLSLVIGPVVNTSPLLGVALRLGCGLFLLYAAWRLWRVVAPWAHRFGVDFLRRRRREKVGHVAA